MAGSALGLSPEALWGRVPADVAFEALRAPLPPVKNPEAPGEDVFLRLSQIVCLRHDLDHAVAERIFELMAAEPWGREHISAVYGKILAQARSDGTARPMHDLIDEGLLTSGEMWFVNHLLTTWYLGIYYHESRSEPVRVSFETSLMWDALDGYMTPPGFSESGPGDWGDLPLAALPRAE